MSYRLRLAGPLCALVLSGSAAAPSVRAEDASARGTGAALGDETRLDLRPVGGFFQHLYEGSFASPSGVFYDSPRAELLVADTGNDLVGIFTPQGAPLFSFGHGVLDQPARVFADAAGSIYVLDNDRTRVKVFSYRGDFEGVLELPGIDRGRSIVALASDEEGNLYVGEHATSQVLVYGPTRKLRFRFGARGPGEGEFLSIGDIAVTREAIYVVDHTALAVQVFDHAGNFVRGWGKHEMGAESFSLPSGIAVDSQERVVVVDALRHEIKYFASDGTFLARFGGFGSAPGQVAYPVDVVVDGADRLYVAEKVGGRIQVLEPGAIASTRSPAAVSGESREKGGRH